MTGYAKNILNKKSKNALGSRRLNDIFKQKQKSLGEEQTRFENLLIHRLPLDRLVKMRKPYGNPVVTYDGLTPNPDYRPKRRGQLEVNKD